MIHRHVENITFPSAVVSQDRDVGQLKTCVALNSCVETYHKVVIVAYQSILQGYVTCVLKEYPSSSVMLNGTRIDLQEAFEEDQNVVLGGRNGFILNKLGVLYFHTLLG